MKYRSSKTDWINLIVDTYNNDQMYYQVSFGNRESYHLSIQSDGTLISVGPLPKTDQQIFYPE